MVAKKRQTINAYLLLFLLYLSFLLGTLGTAGQRLWLIACSCPSPFLAFGTLGTD